MERLERFRELLVREELDGFLVTSGENRRYLSGFTGSSGVLLISPEDALLLTDFRYLEQAEQELAGSGFALKEHEPEMWQTVAGLLHVESGFVPYGRHKQEPRWGFEGDHLVEKDYRSLLTRVGGVQFLPKEGLLIEMRSVKSPEELTLIEKAVLVTAQAWARVWPQIKPGLKETEVAALFEYEQRRLGASGASFETIVASGPRSALPHGTAGERLLQAGDLLVLDGGAVVDGYCSDFTRTIVVGGELREQKQAELYDLVLAAQEAALGGLRPGMTGREGDALGRRVIEEAGYGAYFRHGLGHSLGLAIHEEPRLSPRADTILTPGMVLTVEPGVYLPGWGGIRIEDVVVITENGCQDLTGSKKRLIS